MSFERAFWEKAYSKLGRPYIWAGKGDFAVRQGRIVTMQSLGCEAGYDCSGLITSTIKELGGPDLRGAWGSSRMLDLPSPAPNEYLRLGLWPGHVGIMVGDGLLCLESAGGAEDCLDFAMAQKLAARVQFGWATHGEPKAVRSLVSLFGSKP